MLRLVGILYLSIFASSILFAQERDLEVDATNIPSNPNIDFAGFVDLAQKLMPEREKRRIPLHRFLAMANEPGTLILDTRSKWAFDALHIKGAVHLNFSDFNDEKLRKIIPSKTTRILIYCNNNFAAPTTVENRAPVETPIKGTGKTDDDEDIIVGVTVNQPPLALNILTFINLWGYGYENIFELADIVELNDPRLQLEGTALNGRHPVENATNRP